MESVKDKEYGNGRIMGRPKKEYAMLNIKLSDKINDALEKQSKITGQTKTAIVEAALMRYLHITANKTELGDLLKKVAAKK